MTVRFTSLRDQPNRACPYCGRVLFLADDELESYFCYWCDRPIRRETTKAFVVPEAP